MPKACTAGTYMPISGQSECWPCMEGYYCPANISDYTPYPCPEGYYCPNGTTTANEYPCPSGTFLNHTRGSSNISCISCTPGHYCAGEGLSKPDGNCDPGFFCIRGAKSHRPKDFNNYTPGDCLCPSNATGKTLFMLKIIVGKYLQQSCPWVFFSTE